MDVSDGSIVAIDFRKLLREEKKRARALATLRPTLPVPAQTLVTVVNTSHERNDKGHGDRQDDEKDDDDDDEAPYASAFTADAPVVGLLEEYRLSGIRSVFYVPSFTSKGYADELMRWLRSRPTTGNDLRDEPRNGVWNELIHARRRVMVINGIFPAPLRPLVRAVNALLQNTNGSASARITQKVNHALINDYTEAGMGILPHTDGPRYAPWTVTVSMGGSNVLLKFTPRLRSNEIGFTETEKTEALKSREVFLDGVRNSCVVFSNEAYTDCCHGIDECLQEFVPGIEKDSSTDAATRCCLNVDEALGVVPGLVLVRGPRMSLTFRHKLA